RPRARSAGKRSYARRRAAGRAPRAPRRIAVRARGARRGPAATLRAPRCDNPAATGRTADGRPAPAPRERYQRASDRVVNVVVQPNHAGDRLNAPDSGRYVPHVVQITFASAGGKGAHAAVLAYAERRGLRGGMRLPPERELAAALGVA